MCTRATRPAESRRCFHPSESNRGCGSQPARRLVRISRPEIVRATDVQSTIALNEIVQDEQGRSAEIDVLVHHLNHSVRFIECKGIDREVLYPMSSLNVGYETVSPLSAKQQTFTLAG